MAQIFGEKFLFQRIIAKVGDSTIVAAIDSETDRRVAIKIDYKKKSEGTFGISNEIRAYEALKDTHEHIPRLLWHETSEGGPRAFAMPILGPNLEQLYVFVKRHFSLKTMLMLADQLLRCIAEVHLRGMVHCNIVPQHFLLDPSDQIDKIYIIDFAHARTISTFDESYSNGIKDLNKQCFRRLCFASVNALAGAPFGYRDDLEAIGNVLMYFNLGALPWQVKEAANRHQLFEKMYEKKMSTTIMQLCQGQPEEYAIYFKVCRKMSPNERPNYEELRRHFRQLFDRLNLKFDYKYDWYCKWINDRNLVDEDNDDDEGEGTDIIHSDASAFNFRAEDTQDLEVKANEVKRKINKKKVDKQCSKTIIGIEGWKNKILESVESTRVLWKLENGLQAADSQDLNFAL